ncbi:MAG: HEAT repeat domain-containing protein [Candidatus Latescibacteria bacterium]|nr:HEAT repeat domain-containing protein [Candidatus Latescibacterota bacterium]
MNNQPPKILALTRAKRMFVSTAVFSAIYSRITGAAGLLFIAFLLNIVGIHAAGVGIVIMFYSLPVIFQPVIYTAAYRLEKHNNFVLLCGFFEVLLIFSAVLVPVMIIDIHMKIAVLSVLLCLGAVIQHVGQNTFSFRMVSVVSESTRVWLFRNLWFWMNLSGIFILLVFSLFIDIIGEDSYLSYGCVFVIGLLFGLSGYLTLFKLQTGKIKRSEKPSTSWSVYRLPWENKPFGRLVFMRASTFFAISITLPFYTVYMISDRFLDLNLSVAAVFTGVQVLLFVFGFLFWKHIAEKYGSTPVLKTVFTCDVFVPLLWLFVTSDKIWLIPILLAVNGFLQSGMMVASRNLLFSVIPADEPEQKYLSAWNSYVGFAAAVAPIFAAIILVLANGFRMSYGPVIMHNIHVVFVCGTAFMIIPLIITQKIPSLEDKSLKYMINQFTRGNPLMYAYRTFYLLNARTEDSRAKAVDELGRTKSPLAVKSLIEALDDASPDVRRNAALALGKTGSEEAVAPLIRELNDPESDIKAEVCEALGQLGNRTALEPLTKVLDDTDSRVSSAAITALADIGGENAYNRLIPLFYGEYNPELFPALADGLSRLGKTEIVGTVIDRLEDFRSPVLRLQLLNAICRVLGAQNRFYRIMSMNEYERTDAVNGIIRHTKRCLRRIRHLEKTLAGHIGDMLEKIAESYYKERSDIFLQAVWIFMANIQLVIPELHTEYGRKPHEHVNLAPYIEAVNRFLILKKVEDIQEEGMVFLVICIDCMIEAMR